MWQVGKLDFLLPIDAYICAGQQCMCDNKHHMHIMMQANGK